MKGVILAGGSGSRLLPLTKVTNKHLLPVYDKPMIYYPLNYLINAGIRDVFVVTGGEHFDSIGRLLGSGKKIKETLGFDTNLESLAFGVQDEAGGIAQALGLAKGFVGKDNLVVVLGDNIYSGNDLFLKNIVLAFSNGAHLFLKEVSDSFLYELTSQGKRAKYGIAELGGSNVIGIEEKPENPKTNYVVTGCYLYDSSVFDIIQTLKPSWRNELEITDVNNFYIKNRKAKFSLFEGEWTDAGSIESLYRASELIRGKYHRKL